MLWYRVGGRDEKPGESGIAHFVEHMMFKGTARLEKGHIDYLTTINGGSNNAFTGHDFTTYYFSFASDRWLQALEIEADRMVNTRFDPAEFELERQVILEEARMSLDNPWEALQQAVDGRAFPGHPYGTPIIGVPDDIGRLTRRQVLSFYRRFYVPANATLVIVGDFETSNALAVARRHFSQLPGGRRPRRFRLKGTRITGPWLGEIRRPSGVTRVLMSFPAPSIGSPDFPAFVLLDRILSQGKLCRLHQRLVEEEELVSSLSTDLEETIDPYEFLLRLEMAEDVDPKRAILAVHGVFDRLARYPVSLTELSRAQNQTLTNFLAELETPFDQAFQLGLFETIDRWQNLNSLIERIEQVRPEAIRSCAARYLSPDSAVTCLAPAEEGDA